MEVEKERFGALYGAKQGWNFLNKRQVWRMLVRGVLNVACRHVAHAPRGLQVETACNRVYVEHLARKV